jgi:hypothetical protein
MIATVHRRFSGGMQGKPKIDQAADTLQWFLRRSQRCHSSAHGFSAGKQRQAISVFLCSGDGRANARGENRFAVRPFAALFHVWELVAKRCNRSIRQFLRGLLHEPVSHPCPSTVSKHKHRLSAFRQDEQPGYFANLLSCRERDFFRFVHFVSNCFLRISAS